MPSTTLQRFRVRGFRSCKDTTFSPTSTITALIGLNGSGKTNLLQAVTLLRTAMRRPYRADEADSIAARCQIEADFRVNKKTVYYRAALVFRTNERYGREEVLELVEKWNFKELNWNDGWVSAPWLSLASMSNMYERVYIGDTERVLYRPRTGKPAPGKIPKKIISALESVTNYC